MATMGRLQFGRLSEAWTGEASDFTPLLAERLDQLGRAIGVDLASVGTPEVRLESGRRIDIVAEIADGSEFVIENQYGSLNHDHLTRGLAYAVARKARGLILVAEHHRPEFVAVAHYLNELAQLDRERAVAVWLVEANAIRVDDSRWAPLFSAVVEPNAFVSEVEASRRSERLPSLEAFFALVASPQVREAARAIVSGWTASGHRCWPGPNYLTLHASAPATGGTRRVVNLYPDGSVSVPFNSYAGQNTGIPIEALTAPEFRADADRLFGLSGAERQARTVPGWLTMDRVQPLLAFCIEVAVAYAEALRSATAAAPADIAAVSGEEPIRPS